MQKYGKVESHNRSVPIGHVYKDHTTLLSLRYIYHVKLQLYIHAGREIMKSHDHFMQARAYKG